MEPDTLSREELIQVIHDQQRMIEQLRAEIDELKRRNSAAPFSKGRHKLHPKPPGRKPGQGFFRFRREAEPAVAIEPVKVPVMAGCCPGCGGTLGEAVTEVVSTTDIAAQPLPEVRRYAVETRRCRQCGKKVRGRHPMACQYGGYRRFWKNQAAAPQRGSEGTDSRGLRRRHGM